MQSKCSPLEGVVFAQWRDTAGSVQATGRAITGRVQDGGHSAVHPWKDRARIRKGGRSPPACAVSASGLRATRSRQAWASSGGDSSTLWVASTVWSVPGTVLGRPARSEAARHTPGLDPRETEDVGWSLHPWMRPKYDCSCRVLWRTPGGRMQASADIRRGYCHRGKPGWGGDCCSQYSLGGKPYVAGVPSVHGCTDSHARKP